MEGPEKANVIIEFLRSAGMLPIILVAMWASLASYIHSVSTGEKKHSWVALMAQLMASGLSGMIIFNIGEVLGLGQSTVSIISGIAGWAGARTMEFLEDSLKKMATQYTLGRRELDRQTVDPRDHSDH